MTVSHCVKPIPTRYRGNRFRSRLEARWAVFFDQLKISWFYEYEGYQLSNGWYLPDFWLPGANEGAGAFIEIKAVFPTKPEIISATELCEATGQSVSIVFNDLPVENPFDSFYRSIGFHWSPKGPGCTQGHGHICQCLCAKTYICSHIGGFLEKCSVCKSRAIKVSIIADEWDSMLSRVFNARQTAQKHRFW